MHKQPFRPTIRRHWKSSLHIRPPEIVLISKTVLQGDHVEDFDYTEDGSKESKHRCDGCDYSEDVDILLHLVNLELADILDGSFDIFHRFSQPHDPFFNHSGHRTVRIFT